MSRSAADIKRDMPGWTCPAIDGALRMVRAIDTEDSGGVDVAIDAVEDLRSENEKLRALAEEAIAALDALEDECYALRERDVFLVAKVKEAIEHAEAVEHTATEIKDALDLDFLKSEHPLP